MSEAPQEPSSPSSDKAIDLDSMSLDQLNQVKQQEENRLQSLTNRYAQLRTAASRLSASEEAIKELSPSSEGKDVMIPLTASLYVPARVRDPTKFLLELGTGFYVEKNSKDTSAFLQRKLKLVDANSENVTKAIQMTRQNVESLTMALRGKMLEIRARQEGAKHLARVEEDAAS